MHADVASLSVHTDVRPHIQCSKLHHVLLIVDMPSSHVRGEKRSMPHVRPYRPNCKKDMLMYLIATFHKRAWKYR